jgi:calcineurin-like phosphoesterase family protein
MNEAMVERWNSVVTDKDIVWHLGDFSFGNFVATQDILKRLNGHKHFIKGNHDEVFDTEGGYLYKYFESVQDYKRIKIDRQYLILAHYPILSWHGAHKGSWMIHGHCHGSVNHLNKDTTRIDVGVDNFDYTPVSFEGIKELLSQKEYLVVDHHKKRI